MDLFPLFNSLRVAFVSIVIIFFLGLFLGHFIKKCPRVVKWILDVIFTIPLVLPPTVCGYLLILIFGPRRPIGQFLVSMGIEITRNWIGCVLASVIVAFPLMYRTVRGAFEAYDEDLSNAGKTLGLSNWSIFWRIQVPACKSGIIAATILSFARALGEYGATQMFCGYIDNKTATISTSVAYFWNASMKQSAFNWAMINIAFSAVILISINIFDHKKRRKSKK